MVIAGLDPAIPLNVARRCLAIGIAGSSPAMTRLSDDAKRSEVCVPYSAGSLATSAGTTSFTAPRQPEWVRSNTTPSGPLNFTS